MVVHKTPTLTRERYEHGFVIFDVFESQSAFDRFGEFVAPIARAAGIEEPPKSFSLHTYISV